MGKRPTFILPEGLKLDITPESITIEYDGDMDVQIDLGRRISAIRAGGDLTVRLPKVSGDLVAGGVLRVLGDVEGGGMLRGREVILGRQNIRCKSISASERITLGPATVAADVIIAHDVQIDPKATGRVTVIESSNDRGATKIKGGFSLIDYEDMFGNSIEFLTQRGLDPLGARPPESADAPPLPASAIEPIAPMAKPPKGKKDDEDVDDPLSLSLDDLEPLVEQAERGRKAPKDDLHLRLTEALDRITSCYDGMELPPAVDQLRTLVEMRDYDILRSNITEVWNGLLGFHQKRGIRPHHQVTHAFNLIHGLVQS
ncbi:MAG: hypothetical protein ABMA64_29340 [Myxococcota bacterium]